MVFVLVGLCGGLRAKLGFVCGSGGGGGVFVCGCVCVCVVVVVVVCA